MNTLIDVISELARELFWTKFLLLGILVALAIIIGLLASISDKLATLKPPK